MTTCPPYRVIQFLSNCTVTSSIWFSFWLPQPPSSSSIISHRITVHTLYDVCMYVCMIFTAAGQSWVDSGGSQTDWRGTRRKTPNSPISRFGGSLDGGEKKEERLWLPLASPTSQRRLQGASRCNGYSWIKLIKVQVMPVDCLQSGDLMCKQSFKCKKRQLQSRID